MKKIFTLLLSVILTFYGFSQTHRFKFEVKDKKEISKITRIISIDNVKGNIVWAYANDKEFAQFKTLGYKIQELPLRDKNTKVINMATTVAEMANWDRYPTYDVYVQMMQDFATNYPGICSLDTIGYSQNGRLVLVLKISDNVSQNEAEPEFFYTSSMHGDEVTGFVLMLRLADYLLSNYGTDTEVTDIVNNFEIFINPAANPDGTYNGGNNDVSFASRYLADGKDPNRDFPDPRIGANTPYSQETQDMMNFADAHHFVMSANFHGGAEVYNYPWDTWKTSQNATADANWWQQLGRNYVDTARLVNATYMTDVTSSGITEGGDWYVITGGRQDYMNYYKHCREVTIELSGTKLLSSDLLPAYWNYNKRSLINCIKEAGYGINGTVTNTNGDPLDAKIEITSLDKDNSWVVTDPTNGDYYRPIAPGTYDVTYSSYGYISQTITITVSDWQTTTVQNVILQQATAVDVTGTVTDAGTGSPIGSVKIEFLNTSITPVYTAADGTFTVNGIYENNYDIKASKTGYISVTKNVDISTANTIVDFALTASNAISFEDEVPPFFSFSGNADWTRVQGESYYGDYSMKSGSISDNQTSVMQTELNIITAGNVSFYKKVSSESTYDYLNFYIDGIKQGAWSGEVGWSQDSYPVTTGTHIFKWEYAKDASQISGSDCAWVDDIEFPQYSPLTYTVTFNVSDGTNSIEGASVTFNSQTINTDVNGNASFSGIEPGYALPWTVSKNGYNTQTGNTDVTNQNVNVNVSISQSISVDVILNSGIKLSPNPASEYVNIEFNLPETVETTINIFSYQGKKIKSINVNNTKAGNNKVTWNIEKSRIPDGIYFINIVSGNYNKTSKIILVN